MSTQDDDYRELRAVAPARRRDWLRGRAPTDLRGHWWLALIERAQFDAGPDRGLPPAQWKANVAFAVDLIEAAGEDGMPPYYAASRLALLTSAILKSGAGFDGLPGTLVPGDLARRILASFRLSKADALAAAARLRETADGDEPGDAESDALRDIAWSLPDLEMLRAHIGDASLRRTIEEWLDISDGLSVVP
ncbi:hypothetical protein AB0M20_07430 [Actinoplanes sp. NPDC051633]|uniref:hypothetical protein n=1 Tax=Actinoplanes sp. NPDC051633 TaxID=3155670 RepID=UPI003437D082